jgi:hypothetical protein
MSESLRIYARLVAWSSRVRAHGSELRLSGYLLDVP